VLLVENVYVRQGELPATLEAWKKEVHRRFPDIYDTKLLGLDNPKFSDTELGKLFQSAMTAEDAEAPKVLVAPAHEEYTSKNGLHEAGFDAWMTGAVFLRLGGQRLLADSSNQWKNRLNLMRSIYEFNLAAEDKVVDGAIFHASGFASRTITSELVAAFGRPLHLRKLPASVSTADLEAEAAKASGGSAPSFAFAIDDSGFLSYIDSDQQLALAAAMDGLAEAFGRTLDAPLKCGLLRVSVRWIDDSSAFLHLPDCSPTVASALLEAQAKKLDFKLVTLEEFRNPNFGKCRMPISPTL
jgi:hypothetical protein